MTIVHLFQLLTFLTQSAMFIYVLIYIINKNRDNFCYTTNRNTKQIKPCDYIELPKDQLIYFMPYEFIRGTKHEQMLYQTDKPIKVTSEKIWLKEKISKLYRMQIDGFDEELNPNVPILTNKYRCDYQMGILEFNKQDIGREVVVKYYALGAVGIC